MLLQAAPITSKAGPTLSRLTSKETPERLQQYGPNAIAEARPRHLAISLLRGFWGVVPWTLEAVVVIDLTLGKWVEAGVIAVLLVMNAVMGFRQLRQRLTVRSRQAGRPLADAACD